MKSIYRILISLITILLLISMIFFFSEQSGSDSHSLSQALSGIIASNWLAHTNNTINDSNVLFLKSILDYPIRKLAHLFIYTVLGFGAMACNYLLHGKKLSLRHCFFSILLVFIVASLDEINQYFSDGRGAAFSDVMIDTFGGTCGTYFFFIIKDFINRLKKCFRHQ